tara:strand:+ start:2191 stop:2412 length:222 start_codon:yes stop_codon:yes gene_type:complete
MPITNTSLVNDKHDKMNYYLKIRNHGLYKCLREINHKCPYGDCFDLYIERKVNEAIKDYVKEKRIELQFNMEL